MSETDPRAVNLTGQPADPRVPPTHSNPEDPQAPVYSYHEEDPRSVVLTSNLDADGDTDVFGSDAGVDSMFAGALVAGGPANLHQGIYSADSQGVSINPASIGPNNPRPVETDGISTHFPLPGGVPE